MVNQPTDLHDALKQYDGTAYQEGVAQAERECQEVATTFPLSDWPALPLERYALGQGSSQETFCWKLEFGAPAAGSIKGGNAGKHLIYYRQRDGQWWFNHTLYQDHNQAWQAVRAGFNEAFAKAKAGDWDAIDQIAALSGAAALRTKALYCYFPNDLLPICSLSHIKHFIGKLSKGPIDTSGNDVVRLNRLLLRIAREYPEFSGWNTKQIERFLYHWADPRDQRQVIKIAPGENAEFWQECLDGGYIVVGWDDVGDLREFDSEESFRQRFAQACGHHHNNHQPTVTKKAKEVWILHELEAGDLIVANKGTSQVLAVGEVVEPGYEWRPERPRFKHTVKVKWDTSYAQDIPAQTKWAFATVAPVPQALAAQILAKEGVPPAVGVDVVQPKIVPVDPLFREIADALDRKGQVILYGPPGTGKTYTARRFAVWWLAQKLGDNSPQLLANDELFAQAEQRLSTAQVVQRVWWVVANPKVWSWDRLFKDKWVSYRFGRLQRNYPLVRKGDLVVGYQSTPEKKLVALAKVSRELYEDTDGEQHIDFEPLARIDDGPTYDELQEVPGLRDCEPMRFRNQGTLFALTEDEFDHLAALLTERNPDLSRYLESSESIGPLTRLTFHPSYSYEDFIEGFRPVDHGSGALALRLEDGVFKRICREAQANPKRPYVVLIDEINRANVAKVLGELITLLEKDKRGLMISLPQSKESFTIPPNVYVLGTMNTADRSIKLMDAALRRRFAFIELMPDPSLLEGGRVGNLELDDFLEKLNRRIAAKEGREKQIGHSFLMDGDGPVSDSVEFARRFRQEILPLLQEYCYDDYKVLADYIGDKLVDTQAQVLNEERLSKPDQLIEALEEAFTDKETTA